MAEGDSGYPSSMPPFSSHDDVPGLSKIKAADLDKFLAEPAAGVTVAETASNEWQISVYIDNGLVYDYTVQSMASAREHAAAIQEHGYRSVSEQTPNIATYYPVHRIVKVKVTAPEGEQMPTAYKDQPRGT